MHYWVKVTKLNNVAFINKFLFFKLNFFRYSDSPNKIITVRMGWNDC